MQLQLPYPPTANHYWRRVGVKTLISAKGRQYRNQVKGLCLAHGEKAPEGRLSVNVDVFPPDARRRDLDNVLKALLDSMQHGGIYSDDSLIDRLSVVRQVIVPDGMVIVRIEGVNS